MKQIAIAAFVHAVLLSLLSPANAAKPDGPLIDVTKNPGCGVTGLSRQEKTARNRRLAEFYFQSYVDAVHTKRVRTWGEYGCIANEATVVPGTYQTIPTAIPLTPDNRFMVTKEQFVYWKRMPDWAPIPGSLVVYPSEDGAFYRMRAGGHTADGKLYEFWDVEMIRVNDAGQITHWEFWNDTVALSEIFRLVFNKDIKDFKDSSADTYYNAIEKAPEGAESAAAHKPR